jgi:hypothetical protein
MISSRFSTVEKPGYCVDAEEEVVLEIIVVVVVTVGSRCKSTTAASFSESYTLQLAIPNPRVAASVMAVRILSIIPFYTAGYRQCKENNRDSLWTERPRPRFQRTMVACVLGVL